MFTIVFISEDEDVEKKRVHHCYLFFSGMRIQIRSDPLIFGPPDPVLFSLDPVPDPTCNNGFIKLFLTKFKQESTNSS